MDALVATMMRIGLAAIFSGWIFVIAYGLLTRRIRTEGLLGGADGMLSPARIQLIVVTLTLLGTYIAKAATFKHGDMSLPDIDMGSLGVLGLSHTVHLSDKALRIYLNNQS